MGGHTHRPYPEEFRWKAIELARSSDRSINQIAEELGVSGQTLRNWVHQADVDAGKRGGLTTEEREEFRAMKRENKRLRMERDILKKAAIRSTGRWRARDARCVPLHPGGEGQLPGEGDVSDTQGVDVWFLRVAEPPAIDAGSA